MMHFRTTFTAIGVALLVAACGGGSNDAGSSAAKVTSLKVMGDSLADSGTFGGLKFTVQGADTKIYPELVAQSYGLTLCSAYAGNPATGIIGTSTAPGCSNYAVGGGRINYYAAPTAKYSIVQQLQDASASGNYAAGDMLLIDGGGNDAADLVGAYLGASTGVNGVAAYTSFLGTVLTQADVGSAVSLGSIGMAVAGNQYMLGLAEKFANAITTYALDRGAQRIVILNMPGVTNTPRFQMVLGGIEAARGAQGRADAEALFKSWIESFNARLAARFAGNSKVAIVDFYTTFNNWVANPAQYSFANVRTPACPITGLGSDGLPTYTFPTCTSTALSAAPPAGVTTGAGWWKTYLFSDGFHPTPYGHQLAATVISDTLKSAGWI